MNIKELIEKRAALLAEVQKPETDAKRLEEIRAEIEKLNFAIETAKKIESDEQREEELRAARKPTVTPANGVVYDQANAEQRAVKTREELEKRATLLKKGNKVTIELRAVASSSTAMTDLASDTINPAFAQVGTLDALVNAVHLEDAGCESYKKPFLKTIGEGGITAEGENYTDAEPTFDYADINKYKITAYAEVNEEVEKLPPARYIAEVENAVLGAYRKKIIQQIVNGSGTNELVGIVNAPAKVIAADQRKTLATIDENTLDNIIFDYGGDEDVEGDATLILNKLTLKEFAKVKGTDKKRAYEIVLRGNSGTINGIPFVCTSKLAPFATVTAGAPYMIYGKLKGYELAYFTDVEIAKSTDFKFKQGVIAFKVSGFVGGSPAMYNGFMTVQKAAKSD
jgi:HK97 family phage major capsid protein